MTLSAYIYREHQNEAPGAPLLVLLHGTGGDENQFFELGHQLLPHARLVAPRGDVSEGGALRYFRRTGEGVYDMEDLTIRTDQMAGFVNALEHKGPIYGLGYSNGANILASVLLSHPGIFDGGILMHPLIPWTPADTPGLAGKRILITAGRRDPIAPAGHTERLADYLTRQNADVQTLWHEGGHEIHQEELVGARDFLATV